MAIVEDDEAWTIVFQSLAGLGCECSDGVVGRSDVVSQLYVGSVVVLEEDVPEQLLFLLKIQGECRGRREDGRPAITVEGRRV